MDPKQVRSYSRAFQPAAHGPHAAREAILCGPRSHIHFKSTGSVKKNGPLWKENIKNRCDKIFA